ncbi:MULTISPECIES: DUF2285 domain-containing protein [unclassified Novosphingobium]|uniref:DNA -binding domain-containing protein n=1 Tax=unclassified Novosphingobium TaxID=2644732 RepID=UPI00146E422F|nr:hypothetical protein [Novosphingobium sp. SG919]NMN85180.1 hypothetical protein [Novosphingobium sp. SG916]
MAATPALWLPACHPATLILVAAPADTPGLSRAALSANLHASSQAPTSSGQHIAVRAGNTWLRLLLPERHVAPQLTCLATPDRHWRLRSCALGRLHSVLNGGRIAVREAIDQPSPYQHHRLDLLLRLLDARRAAPGASKRDLAETVVFPGRHFDRAIAWTSSPERRQVHRLLRAAEALVAGGYRQLLQATSDKG